MIRAVLFFVGLALRVMKAGVLSIVYLAILFIAYKGNQPMDVLGAPAEMTYFEFMRDRVGAAKEVEPSRCGWGMFISFGILGPIYSAIYTEVAVHPGGFLDRVTAPDPDIPTGLANTAWYQVPNVWWNVVERLSWTMLGRPQSVGCRFRPVASTRK
jgi:hypothetical protein